MPYDLNGRPEQRTRLGRLLGHLSTRTVEELTPGHPGLVPVAESGDDAAASSSVLDAAEGFDPDAQSVLLHVLEVPPAEVDEVLRLVGQDRYERVAADGAPGLPGMETVAVARVQRVDALHVSQERSRMAGVTARHGGSAVLWQVLQIPA
ncbi:Uncharacterised protein (plasmid) [Tsukamurella tyrosinosolvens]|mgnify:FL=1|uniref:Uncharacterized protein n=1 Tax=Tsukamurella tyrosinosolvens TaxID=57704 RepID=A0A1H4XJT1_TSUTY|nr:hypothetical protein [Tsukamurella tyrosinosolvens]WEL91947.1 hypothetical protein P1N98_12180 [Tsukamurella tyrosinosolvens]SED05942.1 hypothetical protein SAMN04489793_3853 [Tsukamurella tyrosinosolvens]VEH98021.1 Uncharacterised protein [Tsukamurella tyrosinosolvens]